MMTGFKQVGATIVSMALAFAPVHADDTEIFVGSEEVSKKPNVLFIVDTSGSMDAVHEVEVTPYDPAEDYGTACVADSDRVYWTEETLRFDWNRGYYWDGEPPSCDSDRWVNESAIVCDGISDSLDSESGAAIGVDAEQYRERGWRGGRRWRDLQRGNHDDDVDCRGRDSYRFYTAHYMNWYHSDDGGTVEMDRLEIVQDVAKDLVDSVSGVRIGLMRFNGNRGGYVDVAVDDIGSNRGPFKSKLDGYDQDGNTPLSETLYEAAVYYRGGSVEYGHDGSGYVSVSDSRKSGSPSEYLSPIEHECQKNHIVYLTDGEPTYDGGADDEIENDLTDQRCEGNCLDELSQFLYAEDQIPDNVLDREQTVITHAVGFHTDQQLLRDTATEPEGGYYTAYSYAELKNALTSLFSGIMAGTSLFTAPAVSVNAFNRLEHLNQVYFALFRPDEGAVWQGNVKRYKVDPDTGLLVDASDPPRNAVDQESGQFRDEARSWWSDEIDGDDVTKGGAAGEHTLPRNLYTNIDNDTGVDLTAAAYALHEDNDSLTSAMLGVESDTYRTKLLRWIRGVDVDDDDGDGSSNDVRRSMGDPLHSRPELIAYGTESDPQRTLFMMTNEGYLHAINTEDGSELWGFMPQEVLPKIVEQYENPVDASGGRTYGLDGPLSVKKDGDTVHLYAGMRRGGTQYYGLDVSDRTSPELMWTIRRGEGDFQELGQTWSRAIPTRVNIDGTVRDVLVFGGGYDPDQDEAAVRSADDQGRAVYVVDASDGSVLWYGGGSNSAGTPHEEFADMEYGIPSNLRVLDMNDDGLSDRIYVGDMGGQIWRFDIHNGEPADDLVSGSALADIAGDQEADARRFYYAPDVSLMAQDGEQWLALSVGSGWRAHPLDEVVNDRFYMVRDEHVREVPTDDNGDVSYPATIDESDLYDATANQIGQGSENEQEAAVDQLERSEGWYIRLENAGEKVMAESVTLGGEVMFTTYQPQQEGTTSCAPGEGISRAYTVSVRDATPVRDEDGDDALTAPDRVRQLQRGGIPPGPTVIVVEGERIVLVGPEQVQSGQENGPERIYWRSH